MTDGSFQQNNNAEHQDPPVRGSKLKIGIQTNILGPAPDLIPAVDAVAMIDPPLIGFSGLVFIIALLACLTAKNTLSAAIVSRAPPTPRRKPT